MGFAQEIKDFLSAGTSTYKLMKEGANTEARTKLLQTQQQAAQQEMDDPLNQKIKEAKLADLNSRISNRGQQGALALQYQQLMQQLMDARTNAPANSIPGAVPRAIGPAPQRNIVDPNADQAVTFAKGGLVPQYQEGGFVEEDDDEEEYPPAVGGVTSQVTPQVTRQAPDTDMSAQRRGTPLPRPRPKDLASSGLQAVTDAQKYGISQIPTGALPSGGSRRAQQAYFMGAGAAPVNEMLAIYKKIDPNGEMGESERNLAAIGALYNYKMNSNDPEGAQKTAFQMLQHYRTASQRYAAIAKAALDEGEVSAATKAMMKSYANIPDGNDMKLWVGKDGQIGYSVTGEDGKTVDKGIISPDKLGATALNIASGKGFEQRLVAAAGERYNARSAVGRGKTAEGEEEAGPGVPKVKDQGELQQQVGDFVDKWHAKFKETPEGKEGWVMGAKKKIEDAELRQMKGMMYHMRRNNDVTDDQAFELSQKFVGAPPTYKAGQAPPFRVLKNDDTGERAIRFADGRTINLPESAYAEFAIARGQRLKELEAAKNKPPEGEGYGPKVVRAAEAVERAAAGAKSDIAGPAIESFKREGLTPETVLEAGKIPMRALGYGASVPYDVGKRAVGAASEYLPSREAVGRVLSAPARGALQLLTPPSRQPEEEFTGVQ